MHVYFATFPGVVKIVSASMSLTHGISPSVATLEIAPQRNFTAEGGTFSFWYDGLGVHFYDCKVNANSFRWDTNGQLWSLQIFDHRWKWSWGAISGNYNLYNDDGEIKKGTEKTPKELASLLIDAMGETGNIDVGDLPNDARPTVTWDLEVPAEALANLCDQLGFRVVPRLDGSYKLCRVGEGADLPLDRLMEDSLTIDPPERPDNIAVVCGPDRYQADFPLEAVGLDVDGQVKKLSQLSYCPDDDFASMDLPDFMGLLDNGYSKQVQELAKASVFRWYRVEVPCSVPDCDELIGSLRQILPLENSQNALCEYVENPDDDLGLIRVNLPPFVRGIWCPESDGIMTNVVQQVDPTVPDDEDEGKVQRKFSLDTAHGIVMFDQPVYKNSLDPGDGSKPAEIKYEAAELYLRTACYVRNSVSLSHYRHWLSMSTGGGFGTPTRYLRHNELTVTHIPTYDSDYNVTSVETNAETIDQACNYYLTAAMQEYELKLPVTFRYPKLVAIELDGAIQNVTWSISTSGAFTAASRNCEQLHAVLPYHIRRAEEKKRQATRAPYNSGGWNADKMNSSLPVTMDPNRIMIG
jgi:hypothetical protein